MLTWTQLALACVTIACASFPVTMPEYACSYFSSGTASSHRRVIASVIWWCLSALLVLLIGGYSLLYHMSAYSPRLDYLAFLLGVYAIVNAIVWVSLNYLCKIRPLNSGAIITLLLCLIGILFSGVMTERIGAKNLVNNAIVDAEGQCQVYIIPERVVQVTDGGNTFYQVFPHDDPSMAYVFPATPGYSRILSSLVRPYGLRFHRDNLLDIRYDGKQTLRPAGLGKSFSVAARLGNEGEVLPIDAIDAKLRM